MTKHAELSASGARRWMNCPGSVVLSRDVPLAKTSIYGAEGSVAHQLAERVLTGTLEKAAAALGETISCEGNNIDITEEMITAVNKYLSVLKPFQVAANAGEATFYVELRVSPKFDEPLNTELFGTADAIAFDPDNRMLHVIDFKYGKGVRVEAQNNPQLLYYGLGTLAHFDISNSSRWRVALTIVQPRYTSRDGTYKYTHVLTAAELYDWGKKTLLPAIKRTQKKTIETKAGNWCLFCTAKVVCPTKKEEQQQLINEIFSVDSLLPNPTTLMPAQLTEILTKGKAWLVACENLALDKAKHGETIPGFRLTNKIGNRRWISENDVITELEPMYGDVLFQRTLKTPAKLEKLIGKDLIADYTERPELGETLKPCTEQP